MKRSGEDWKENYRSKEKGSGNGITSCEEVRLNKQTKKTKYGAELI